MRRLLRALRAYDPQLLLWQHPQSGAWLLLRQPARYGVIPKRGYSNTEVMARVRAGVMVQVTQLLHEPGSWLLDWLAARDLWARHRPRDVLHALDARNEIRARAIRDAPFEAVRYQVRQDWKHIRDELRGEPWRRWTISI